MIKKAIQIDEKDNVATTTSEVEVGESIEIINPDKKIILNLKATEAIPFGYKLAIKSIERGETIVKYGEVIGIAKQLIKTGAMVNTHNVGSVRMPTKGKELGIH